MFDMSFGELCIILIIALVVLGPKQLPQVAYRIGRWLRFFKNSFAAVGNELREEMQADMESKHKKLTEGIKDELSKND